MKYIFYLLIVINLVFLVWKFGLQQKESLWQDEEEQRIDVTEGATAMPAGVDWDDGFETLPPESDPDDALPGEASALPATAKSDGCFEIGPIQTREQAESFITLLEPSVKVINLVIRPGDVPDGWWVLYPKAATREAALANRHMLESHGIYDSWLFDKGPLEGAISLGVYATREEAEQALLPLTGQGIAAKVIPRLVRGEVLWLKIPWPGLPLALDEAVQTLNSQDPALAMPAPAPCYR